MIKFKVNGKDLSSEDLNMCINRDSVTGKTEISFFTDSQDVVIDNSNATINIYIGIECDDKLAELMDESQNSEVNIQKTIHALAVARHEFDSLVRQYYKACGKM